MKENNSECRLMKKFKSLEQEYTNLRIEINNVKTDFEMMNQGWNINFAVDFHQIYRFLNKERTSIVDKNEFTTWQRAASTFIFSKQEEVKRTFILPSHLIELRNFILRFKEMSINKEKTRLPNLELLQQHEREKLEKANNIFKEGKNLKEEFMNEIFQLIEDKFLSLYRLISDELSNQIAQIRYVNKHVKLFTECWDPEIVEVVQNKHMESIKNSPWYISLYKIRSQKNLIVNNVRDARAIDAIMALNEYFQKKGESEIVLLVSDAESMRKVLNWDKDDELRKEKTEKDFPLGIIELKDFGEIRILRTSDSFLAYLLNKSNIEDIKDPSEQRKQIIQNLENHLGKMNKLTGSKTEIINEFNKCKNKCESPKKEEWCNKIEKHIEKFENEFKRVALYSMATQSKQLIETQLGEFSKISQKDSNKYENIKEIVKFLLSENPGFNEKLKDKIKKLNEEIDETLSELRNDIIKGLSFESFRIMSYRLRRLHGIPYDIEFQSDKIKDALKNFFTLMDEHQRPEKNQDVPGPVKKKWKDIIDLTEDKSLGIERKLLQAAILFSNKFYHDTLLIGEEIANELKKYPRIEKEFKLLECLANYRLFKNKEIKQYFEVANEIINKYRSKYEKDARFLNMDAILKADSSEVNVNDPLKDLSDAEKLLEKMDDKKNKNIHITILNNIIYLTLQKVDIDLNDIKELEDKVTRIKHLSPQENWDADLWHTEGLVFKKKGLLTEPPDHKLLEKAKENFKKALQLVEEYNLDRFRRKEFYQDIKEVKSKLKENDWNYT